MKALLVGLAIAGLFEAAKPAESAFNGTWRVDVSSLTLPAVPEAIRLKDGIYASGDPDSPTRVRADGRFHRIAGDGYVDELAITVLDRHRVRETDKLRGKIVYMTTYIVSADGRTMTTHTTDLSKPDGKPVKSERIRKRVGQPDRGAHLISGSWQVVKLNVLTSSYLDWILKLDGNAFSSSSTNGYGFDAVIDGPPVPVRGDNAHGMKAVTMPAKNTIVETASSNDVVGSVMTLTMMPDGKSIKATSRNVKEGTATTFMLYKR